MNKTIEYENLKPHSWVNYQNKRYQIDHIVVSTKNVMVHLKGLTNPVNLDLLEVEKIKIDASDIVTQYRSKNKN